MHGPFFFAPDQRVEQIHQWLEEYTFYSRCINEETNQWLARVKISTSSGIILHHCSYLTDCPVTDTNRGPGGCHTDVEDRGSPMLLSLQPHTCCDQSATHSARVRGHKKV